jgi:hypothetical protein
MIESSSASRPRLTIVLATDAYETVRPVIASLRKQTARAHLEVLLIAPPDTLGAVDWSELGVFGSARVVNVTGPLSLSASRAIGVRAASASIVFIGETHCFPHPQMTDVVLASFTDERCAAVVPAITNANPRTALSWASYLADYGRWGPGRPGGTLERPPVYNAHFDANRSSGLGIGSTSCSIRAMRNCGFSCTRRAITLGLCPPPPRTTSMPPSSPRCCGSVSFPAA